MPDEVEESGPYAIVVRLGVFRDQGRRDRAEEVVGSWHGAVEQEQPSGLKVRGLLEPVPDARLNCQSVPQKPLNKLGAAHGRTQDDDAVSLRVDVSRKSPLSGLKSEKTCNICIASALLVFSVRPAGC